MTFLIPLLILALAATLLLVVAGRESARLHGTSPRPVRHVSDVARLMSLGYDALNHASEEAARKRLS